MAAAVQHLEEILKEYFLFRGFTNTLKAFDVELKSDKDKCVRVSTQNFSSLLHDLKYHMLKYFAKMIVVLIS